MSNPIDLLKMFLDSYEVEGVCGYIIDDSDDEEIQVVIIFSQEWLDDQHTSHSFIIKRYKLGIRDDIKNWLDIEIPIGSIVLKTCDFVKEKVVFSESVERKNTNWTKKADRSFFEVLNTPSKETFSKYSEYLDNIIEKSIHHFIQSNLNISDQKEMNELHRILKKPFKSHLSKSHKLLLKNRFRLSHQG